MLQLSKKFVKKLMEANCFDALIFDNLVFKGNYPNSDDLGWRNDSFIQDVSEYYELIADGVYERTRDVKLVFQLLLHDVRVSTMQEKLLIDYAERMQRESAQILYKGTKKNLMNLGYPKVLAKIIIDYVGFSPLLEMADFFVSVIADKMGLDFQKSFAFQKAFALNRVCLKNYHLKILSYEFPANTTEIFNQWFNKAFEETRAVRGDRNAIYKSIIQRLIGERKIKLKENMEKQGLVDDALSSLDSSNYYI